MKFLILAACVSIAAAAPANVFGKAAKVAASPFVAAAQVVAQGASAVARTASGNDYDAAVLRFDNDVRADGYHYDVETSNGIKYQAQGELKQVDKDQSVLVNKGSYAYPAPDGTLVEINYIADENGYQPQGNVLPVAPPVPEAIARSLAYIAAHPSSEVKKY